MRKLIRKSKLGKPPQSFADIRGLIRNLIENNPSLLQSQLKEVIGSTAGFNNQNYLELINLYNNTKSSNDLIKVFNFLSPIIDQVISKRKIRAEEIIKRQNYSLTSEPDGTFTIKDLTENDTYHINLTTETCTCLDFQRLNPFGLWCKHLYACWALKNNLVDII